MADATEPSQTPPPPPAEGSSPASDPSSMDLPPNIAGALACLPLVGGIIFYILEKRNGFVRFYAMQSIILGGAWLLCGFVYSIASAILSHIPIIGPVFAILLSIAWALISIAVLVLFLVAVVKAFTGVRWDIPYIGPMARRQVEGRGTT
jgi:uncharacterized membrane protein